MRARLLYFFSVDSLRILGSTGQRSRSLFFLFLSDLSVHGRDQVVNNFACPVVVGYAPQERNHRPYSSYGVKESREPTAILSVPCVGLLPVTPPVRITVEETALHNNTFRVPTLCLARVHLMAAQDDQEVGKLTRTIEVTCGVT